MGEGDYYTTLIGSETNISLQRMDDILRNDLQYMKQHLSIILVVNGHQSTKKSHSHQWTWYATPFYPTQVCNINKCSMAFSLSDESECKLRFTQKVFLLAICMLACSTAVSCTVKLRHVFSLELTPRIWSRIKLRLHNVLVVRVRA